MAEKQCGKCGEMVDDAKAFCPACGNAFVDERKRTTKSDFDMSEHTVKLGETMYNQMLSDMGLSIPKHPKREEKKAEVITPLAPAAPAKVPPPPAQPSPAPANKGTSRTLKIIGIIAFAVIAFVTVVIAAAVVLFLYFR